MKKHTLAIRALKQTIKELAAEASILRGTTDGPTRHLIRMGYIATTRRKARASLLAYGLLRGKPYRSMEPVSEPGLLAYTVYNVVDAIHKACGENEVLKAEWTLARVKSLVYNGVDTLVATSEAA